MQSREDSQYQPRPNISRVRDGRLHAEIRIYRGVCLRNVGCVAPSPYRPKILRIRILPCLKKPLAGSVALKVLNVILLKADVLLRAKVIASNSEESLLITPADKRKNPATTK